MNYHFNTATETYDVAQVFKENPEVELKSIRMELMNKLASKSIHLKLSEGIQHGGKHFIVGNKLFRVGSYSKFSLEKDKQSELEEFLSSEDVIVIHSQTDDKEKVLHITYTSRSLVTKYLEEACEMIKQDLETLREKREELLKEQAKQDNQYIDSDGMANIQQLLQKRSA